MHRNDQIGEALPGLESRNLCCAQVNSLPQMCLYLFIFFLFFKFYFIYYYYYFTLQYCIGFATHQHESTTGVHMFPIPNPAPPQHHPSESSQCNSPKHPAHCFEPRLVIHLLYDIIHVSMPYSQIIPPSPSPTETKRLFYTAVSLLMSRI